MANQTTQLFALPVTDIKAAPDPAAETIRQGLYGEPITVIETGPGWTRIRNLRDGYEGYVSTASPGACDHANTHWVATRATLFFREPDIKSPVLHRLSFGAEIDLASDTANAAAASWCN
ncbi:MAG: SH3 domain-containing protein [Methylococcales bacterium]|nr:SH3 domain-containing protein [Methylococcales bacterium]